MKKILFIMALVLLAGCREHISNFKVNDTLILPSVADYREATVTNLKEEDLTTPPFIENFLLICDKEYNYCVYYLEADMVEFMGYLDGLVKLLPDEERAKLNLTQSLKDMYLER